jgi:RNA polymerase sigma-70 factor, ECF subfamily
METLPARDVGTDTDAALVAATKRGDRHAFEKLVSRHQQRVLAVAQRITNNREDAEDVVQECFHKAFLHLDGFQEKSLFATWLIRIAMNEAFMVLRRRRRVLAAVSDNSAESEKSVSPEFADQRPDPEERCLQHERTRLLTKAMNYLNSEIRTTIFLREIEERSVQETAQMLGTSVSAVKSRVSRGRRKLRRTLSTGFLRDPQPVGRWRSAVDL